MRQLWLTGASGFLGSNLLRGIDSKRYRVVSFSKSSGTVDHRVDLAEKGASTLLREIAARDVPPEIVVHLAAGKPSPKETLPGYVRANVLSTANLLEAVAELPLCHFIMVSTLSVYGVPLRNPVLPDDPPLPFHPYAVTKRAAEQLTLVFEKVRSQTVLRFPSLYGAGQSDSFLDGLARRALSGGPIELFGRGRGLRDALHVSDAVRVVLAAIETTRDGRQRVINAGCGQAISICEWASALVSALGVNAELLPVDNPPTQTFDLYADNGAAYTEFGFVPMSLTRAMRVFADELRSMP